MASVRRSKSVRTDTLQDGFLVGWEARCAAVRARKKGRAWILRPRRAEDHNTDNEGP